MAQLQQWTITCTLCEGSAEYHCNSCGDVLCPRCRDMHMKSNATRHHEVVPYSDRVGPCRLATHCSDHPGHVYLHWCKTCDKAVCGECITSKHHAGHEFMKVSLKMEQQAKEAQAEMKKYSGLLERWENSIQEVQREMRAYEKKCHELDKEISWQANKMCDQVRAMESRKKKQLDQILKSQMKHFKDHESFLTNDVKKIKGQLTEVEDKLRSQKAEQLLQSVIKDIKLTETPEREQSSFPVFTPGKVDNKKIESMFGDVSKEHRIADGAEKADPESSRESDKPKTLMEDDYSLYESLDDIRREKTRPQPNKPAATVISSINIENIKRAPDIACTDSGHAWVRTADNRLQLMRRPCIVKKTIELDFNMGTMTITPRGDLLVTVHSNYCVKSVSREGQIKTCFTTEWKPHGICCLLNEDVMVTFYGKGKVVQYTGTGALVRELDSSLFKHPSSVAQNKVNQHIYVCDVVAVLAFDVNGVLQYKYIGHQGTRFGPEGVCADKAGHVIIADYSNQTIHIVDSDGGFLRYMLTQDQGLYYPYTVGTDSDGYAWIGEWKYSGLSRVKICKYTS